MDKDEKLILYRLLQQWVDHPDDDVVPITELIQIGNVPLIIARRAGWAYRVPGEKGYRITAKGIRALAAEKAAQS